MNIKAELAEDVARLAPKVPGASEAAAHAVTSAGRLLEETMPRSMTGSIVNAEERAQHLLSGFEPSKAPKGMPGDAAHTPGEAPHSFSKTEAPSLKDYEVSHYRNIPARNLMLNIRTADGVSLQHVDGPSRIVFDDKNAVQHVLVNRNATDLERDKQLLTAGYAGLIHNDVLAQEAASKVVGQSIGFFSHPIERLATPEQMRQNAVDGARAYFEKDGAGANNYTKFLTERFGPANLDEARFALQPNGFMDTSTKLASDGIAITPKNRAAAADPRTGPFAGAFSGITDREFTAGLKVEPAATETHSGRIIPNVARDQVEAAVKLFESGPLAPQVSGYKLSRFGLSPKPAVTRDILDLRSPEFRNLGGHE